MYEMLLGLPLSLWAQALVLPSKCTRWYETPLRPSDGGGDVIWVDFITINKCQMAAIHFLWLNCQGQNHARTMIFFNIHGKKGREEKVMKIPTYYYVYRSPTFNSEKIKSLVTYKQISASFPAVSQTVFRVLLVDSTALSPLHGQHWHQF